MICKQCGSSYERMEGTQRFRKDYGYCSVKCLEDSKDPCPGCGALLKRHTDEKLSDFAKRIYCSQPCAASHIGSQPPSQETRARMSESARSRSPEHLAKISKALRSFWNSPEGKKKRHKTVNAWHQWRRENPSEFAEVVRKQDESRREGGVYKATSERLTDFWQTPEGQAQKERYSQMYTGKKRPPRVTAKVKASLREFWDSPEGFALREEISIARTGGHKEAPHGPFWPRQASKVRQRDNHTCVCCGATKKTTGQRLSVHHIYPRRLFGYVPGENRHFVWSDHPANLITLCRACHIQVEMGVIPIPPEYQERADLLWAEFIA